MRQQTLATARASWRNQMQHVRIRYIVRDVDRSIHFYTRLLAFTLQFRAPKGFAILEKGWLVLLLSEPGFGAGGSADHRGQLPTPGGWNRIQVPVLDLASTYDGLSQAGVSCRTGIVEGRGGKSLLVEDPSGNLVELIEQYLD